MGQGTSGTRNTGCGLTCFVGLPLDTCSIWQTNFKGLRLTVPAVRELVSKASVRRQAFFPVNDN